MALSIACREASSLPVDLTGLTPDWAHDKSLSEIKRFELLCGRHRGPLEKFFQVSGDPTDGRIEFCGDFSHAHHLGSGMTAGEIRVTGNAGRLAGAHMSGGKIQIDGNCGDQSGC